MNVSCHLLMVVKRAIDNISHQLLVDSCKNISVGLHLKCTNNQVHWPFSCRLNSSVCTFSPLIIWSSGYISVSIPGNSTESFACCVSKALDVGGWMIIGAVGELAWLPNWFESESAWTYSSKCCTYRGWYETDYWIEIIDGRGVAEEKR